MKELKFSGDEDSQKRFEVLYNGFVAGGHLVTQKGLNILRREMIILDTFAKISEEFPCGKKITGTEEPGRKLKEGEQVLRLDDADSDIIYNYITAVPWSTGSSAKLALETIDWFKSS